MALVTVMLAAANNNLSHVDLTYDNITFACDSLSWTNPEGHWTFTLSRNQGGQQIVRTLNPGDSGSVNVPNGWSWGTGRGALANFSFSDSWTRA